MRAIYREIEVLYSVIVLSIMYCLKEENEVMYYQVIDDTLWIGSTQWEGSTSGTSITNNNIVNLKNKNAIYDSDDTITINSTSLLNVSLIDVFFSYNRSRFKAVGGLDLSGCTSLANIDLGNLYGGKLYLNNCDVNELNIPFNINVIDLQISGNNKIKSINNLNGCVFLRLIDCINLTNLDLSNCCLAMGGSDDGDYGLIKNIGVEELTIKFAYFVHGSFGIRECNKLKIITIMNEYVDYFINNMSIRDCPNLTTVYGDIFTGKDISSFPNCPKLEKVVSNGYVEGRPQFKVSIANYYDIYGLGSFSSPNRKFDNYFINIFVDKGLFNVSDGLFHLWGNRGHFVDMAGALIVDSRGVMTYKQGNDIKFPVNDNLTVYIIPTDDKVNLNAVIKAVANPQ